MRFISLTFILNFVSANAVFGSLFKSQIVAITGRPGDYYVISARAEDPFQSLEMSLICSGSDHTVFSARMDDCLPEVYSDESWHFYYKCQLHVNAVEEGKRTKKDVVRADSTFTFRRQFLLSIGIEQDKYVLWNGDRRNPLMSDTFLRFMGKAEMKSNASCTPDQLVVKGTIWDLKLEFIVGKIPTLETESIVTGETELIELPTTSSSSTTTSASSTAAPSVSIDDIEGSGQTTSPRHEDTDAELERKLLSSSLDILTHGIIFKKAK